jgi:hypothetical protein
VTVKPEGDVLATVPDVPPAAGPDRALDPLPVPKPPLPAGEPPPADEPLLAAAEPPLVIVLTIPYAPLPIATTAAPAMTNLITFRLDIGKLLLLVAIVEKLPAGAEGPARLPERSLYRCSGGF